MSKVWYRLPRSGSSVHQKQTVRGCVRCWLPLGAHLRASLISAAPICRELDLQFPRTSRRAVDVFRPEGTFFTYKYRITAWISLRDNVCNLLAILKCHSTASMWACVCCQSDSLRKYTVLYCTSHHENSCFIVTLRVQLPCLTTFCVYSEMKSSLFS
jgi:hypothetical protein